MSVECFVVVRLNMHCTCWEIDSKTTCEKKERSKIKTSRERESERAKYNNIVDCCDSERLYINDDDDDKEAIVVLDGA